MRESAIVTYDENIIDYSIGTAGSVEFNFDRIWAHIKKLGPVNFDKDKLEFFHVHPQGFISFSSTDENCMKGLNLALGIPIRFCVVVFENADLFNTKIDLKWAVYNRGFDHDPQYLRLPSRNELLFLKYLAYGVNAMFKIGPEVKISFEDENKEH